MVNAPPPPDWEKQHLFIVDPVIWPRYRGPSYDLRPGFAELREAFRALGIHDQVLTRSDSPLDIWIRDWGFVEGCYFQYDPPYAPDDYTPEAIKKARTGLDKRTGIKPRSLPLKFDGGNLVHNGSVGIVTDRLVDHNSGMSKTEIEKAIISLGFERVVFIPAEKEDEIGHADGIVRFVSSEVLLVSHSSDSVYRRKLDAALQSAKLDCEIVPFPSFVDDDDYDGVPSAVGCYINFILTAQGAVLPTFDDPLDDQALAILEKHLSLPIKTVKATALAKFGGVFNCATLTF